MGLLPGEVYSYRVRAQNSEGMSEWSACESLTLAAGAPAAPPPPEILHVMPAPYTLIIEPHSTRFWLS